MSARASLVVAFAALALIAAGQVLAGAWPREPGGGFVSARTDLETTSTGPELSFSLYGEYGLTRRITLVGQFSNSDQPFTPSRAAAGFTFALSGPDAVNRFAVGLGVSTPPDLAGVMTQTRLETSLHWGRGFESRFGGGWVTATARVLFARDEDDPITDFYGLIGLRPAEGWMTMLSASRYEDEQGVYYKVSPSVGFEVRDRLWVVPSLMQELSDDRSTGVGLALWFSF
jgi:hypothetical protein